MTTGAPVVMLADKPTLTDELVILRPFEDRDVEAMAAAVADPEVGRLNGSFDSSADAAEVSDLATLRRWYATRNEQPDRLDLAIVDRATGRCVGEAVLNEDEEGNRSVNVRILVGPGGRDRGLGTEATRLLLGHAFEVVRLHRVGLDVYAFNPHAQRAYEKVGSVVEGVRRDALRLDDEWVDAIVTSVLDHEWAAHRGRTERHQP